MPAEAWRTWAARSCPLCARPSRIESERAGWPKHCARRSERFMPRGAASRPREIFLSHSSKDRRFVSKLERLFREHGIRYWYNTRHIVAATKWHDEIGRALDRCDWFALVLPPSAVRSAWVKRELLYALE